MCLDLSLCSLGPSGPPPIPSQPPVGAVLTCFTAPIALALRRVEGRYVGAHGQRRLQGVRV